MGGLACAYDMGGGGWFAGSVELEDCIRIRAGRNRNPKTTGFKNDGNVIPSHVKVTLRNGVRAGVSPPKAGSLHLPTPPPLLTAPVLTVQEVAPHFRGQVGRRGEEERKGQAVSVFEEGSWHVVGGVGRESSALARSVYE